MSELIICVGGWIITNGFFMVAEEVIYGKTFLHWGDAISIAIWGFLWLFLRLRQLLKQTIIVNINHIGE
ncbi:MAG: hypothetical protein C0602_00245 [Denitrovibrio sp.]|nr:MAG: hypothetical protein C0602_00245 [Denitrovibrio sp.]